VLVGADLTSTGAVRVRVWAPNHDAVSVVMDGRDTPLAAEPCGYRSGVVPGRAGSRYGFRFPGDDRVYPDPASRFQPEGPHALSEVVDPAAYEWRDEAWAGLSLPGQVLYELHVGTYTPEGTWRAAARHLPRLRDLGVTAIQMMPVAEFDGEFGWGYDGVAWFAPTRLYGRPDDLRAFVDAAHQLGLGVVLDVVYNHLGPSGNYLSRFASGYVSNRYQNEWGDAIDFEGPEARPVRDFVLANVEYWIREFHIDGFRLDATQQIFDASPTHILSELAARARSTTDRGVLLTAENEPQHTRLIRGPDEGGYGLDAMYNDDFHHAARVALTGIREAYYSDYEGSSRELLGAARWGFLFQGQHYSWQNAARGTPALDRRPEQFVCFIENHDQVANFGNGSRLNGLAAPGNLRALTALLLLMPATPLLFQGQEWGSKAPWNYFAAHRGSLGTSVREGRRAFMAQFKRLAASDATASQPDPTARGTFEACRLDHRLDEHEKRLWQLHQDLLALRRTDPVFGALPRERPEGATLNDDAFLLRFGRGADVRLLVVNLDNDLVLARAAEPLVAPPEGTTWSLLWSSESPAYGGGGTPPPEPDRWLIPGHAAVVLAPGAGAAGKDSDGR
jgi:maltooligosyltrehalose trehalohydrolase